MNVEKTELWEVEELAPGQTAVRRWCQIWIHLLHIGMYYSRLLSKKMYYCDHQKSLKKYSALLDLI